MLEKKYDQNINVPNNYAHTVRCAHFTQSARDREIDLILIPRILIARKLYTILECLREQDRRYGSGR